jgi:uncharacterized membrane protein
LSDKKIVSWLPFSHHHQNQLDRCVMVPLGQMKVALCARCLGLYPVMLVVLAGQIAAELRPSRPLDWWIVTVGIGPALADWALSRLDAWRGNNTLRVVTGAIAGASLGRSLYLYFRDGLSEVFLVQVLLIVFSVVAVEIVRMLQIR